MLIIQVKDTESIDRALKRLKRKFDSTKTKRNLQQKKHYVKPSVAKRSQKIKAKYIQRLKTREEMD